MKMLSALAGTEFSTSVSRVIWDLSVLLRQNCSNTAVRIWPENEASWERQNDDQYCGAIKFAK